MDVTLLVPHLLGNVRFLVTSVDGHLKYEADAVRLLNQTRGLPNKLEELSCMRLVVEQHVCTFELR